jgi:thiopeptide-type bacteriocin biosynthesis protein
LKEFKMPATGRAVLYRNTGVALLRSAVAPVSEVPAWWPHPADARACRAWLDEMWSASDFAAAVGLASSGLAGQVAAIRAGRLTLEKDVRRATLATARYVLRATGRPTPFGLFAGVAPVTVADDAGVRWGVAHRPVVRADTQWLSDLIARLEAVPELLERLEVVATNLAVVLGRWLEAPHGPDRVRVSMTGALGAVRDGAGSPVRFGVLADKLAVGFGADELAARAMLTELVRQRVLNSCLRAPFTVVDPLGYLVDQLRAVGADGVPDAAPLLAELVSVRAEISQHNHRVGAGQEARKLLAARMRRMSMAARQPLAADLRLDCDVQIPARVVREVERAAGVLLRLTREPNGMPVWRAYHRAFVERYGVGTLAPLADVVHPDTGLGYPATYPGSVFPAPAELPLERDQRLLARAWRVLRGCRGELVLTDDDVDALAEEAVKDARIVPPHVEVATRVEAVSLDALTAGDFMVRVNPARAGGVLTSRFTPTASGSGLEQVYRALPATTESALPVQLSFGPAYPHAENISRVPVYLPHVLSLGEHRPVQEGVSVISVEDVAVTATADRLFLVSLSQPRVIEPQVFHALALDKQAPPLARFLAHLTRGLIPSWTAFDWGPHAEALPYLPQVRYGRAILAPERWRLTTDDLPGGAADPQWRDALNTWRGGWGCPTLVELRDDDRTLRLELEVPLHAAILRAHLDRRGTAILNRPTDPAELGWIGGHAHEIVLPLASTRRPVAPPPLAALPVVTNTGSAQMPAAPGTRWLFARLHTHPDRHAEIISHRLPILAAELDGAPLWFMRYRTSEQSDHLRIRVRVTTPEEYGRHMATVGAWARRLHRDGLAGRLVLDTYTPEVGRYGSGAALHAAEAVFVADSRLVTLALRHLPALRVDLTTLAVANMVGITAEFLGPDEAMTWLVDRPAPAGSTPERTTARTAVDLAVCLTEPGAVSQLQGWPDELAGAWQARAAALATYRSTLPADAQVDMVMESLLHMHHNRLYGIDPDHEATCRRLARHAALSWRARTMGTSR